MPLIVMQRLLGYGSYDDLFVAQCVNLQLEESLD
jgi:hypothetical protein